MKHTKKLFAAICLLLLSACASTTLVTEWHDTAHQGDQFNKMFVIGVTNNKLHRRTYEDAVVKQFQQKGITAVASYTVMAELSSYDDKEKLKQVVINSGADGVLVAKLINVDKSERYIPPSYNVMPAVGYYGGYHRAVAVSYQPGYVQSSTLIRISSEVFSAQSETLVWATETESFNPGSYQKVIKELAKITYTQLNKNGFIQ